MRRIGAIPNEQDANRFRDYLLTLGIKAEVNAGEQACTVWGLDEDRIAQARSELAEFEQSPRAEKYAAAVQAAQERRNEEVNQALAASKLHVRLQERWDRPLVAQIPVTLLMIGICVVIAVMSGFGQKIEQGSFAYGLYISKWVVGPTLGEVRSGQIWRLVTPMFLHFSFWHLLFNMYILYLLGGWVESNKGPVKFLALVLVVAAASNLAQYIDTGPAFGGMSGVDFGLFGYVWMKSKYAPEEGFDLPREVVVQFMVWMLLCVTGVIGHLVKAEIANTAHIVGMLAGMILAIVPLLWRRLLR